MSQVFRRYRDVDIVSTTNPGQSLASVISTVQDEVAEIQSAITPYNFQSLSGVVDGINAVFTLPHTPDAGSLLLFVNGVGYRPGLGNDFTLEGNEITLASPPSANSVLWAHYSVTTAL